MNMIKTICALALVLLAAPLFASEGEDMRMERLQIDRLDNASLQRGAKTFVNYCLNCHSAQNMRYNRLKDIGLAEDQIKNNLMFATSKIGDTMSVAMPRTEAKAWFGAAPPDLSVEARIRGDEWLYGYLRAFYRDSASRTGWNNLMFPNVAMPNPLWRLQGVQKLVETEYASEEQAQAAAVKIGDMVQVEERHVLGKDGKEETRYVVKTLQLDTPGLLKPAEYKVLAADLVNYMDFMAEPAKVARAHYGIVVVIFLGALFVLAFLLKREYWKDVH
jgi:ubiquinol-cytochrome c reductase cytochrome c1 subunit